MRRAGPSLFLALALTGVAAGDAGATVAIALSVEDMAVRADTVVRATVRGQMSAWDEAHRRIHTYTELEVTETWVGEAPPTVVVRTLGGVVGEIGMRVSGMARFRSGEDVVLFLRTDPLGGGDDQFEVVGLSQGKFRVESSEAGAMAVPSTEGLALAHADTKGRIWVGRDGPAPGAVRLSDLSERVKAARVHRMPKPRRRSPPKMSPAPPEPSPVAPSRPSTPTRPETPPVTAD